MHICSFCGRSAQMKTGSLRLCEDCRMQLVELSPGSLRYGWYLAAVKRALFPVRYGA